MVTTEFCMVIFLHPLVAFGLFVMYPYSTPELEACTSTPLKVTKSEPSNMITASPCPPTVDVISAPASVLVITGLAPAPLFWKTTGSAAVPVAVMVICAMVLSVKPAAMLKVTPPAPTP